MKKTLVLAALLVIINLSYGFSRGQAVVKETRSVTGFTKVSFGVSGNLYIKFGPEFQVVLEGEKDVLEDIITEVSGGRLNIKKENWRIFKDERVTINITMPEINGLSVSGSGKAEIMDAIKSADNLDLSVSGSGKLLIAGLEADALNCGISGSGDIILGASGTVDRADISISGSGSFSGEKTEIDHLKIRVSGSGNCYCNVTDSLEASISGSGNVTYIGNPRIDARVSGSGHVRSK